MSDEMFVTDRPATFGDVFSSREFRFIFASSTLSWIGDHLAKAAVTALVFHETRSVALSAAAFALSYLPWIAGGPLLATIAERHPYRRVMVTCDLIRMSLIALVAIPDIPVWLILLLLFATALANPPFQAARSALLPQLLHGDRYVVGLSLQQSTGQAAQIAGYALGGAIAPFYPRVALLLNAATFAISAVLIVVGLGDRRPIGRPLHNHLARDTADGFRVVFGTPVLRAIALLVFTSMLFAIVPEGLAAAWAADLAEDSADRGWMQAMIMVANPIGFILGGMVVGRLIRPDLRRRLIRPFAVLAPLALVPALLGPPVGGIALMAAVCGFAVAGMMPPANGLFVQALPASYRARAFGVMQGGMQVMQGVAVIATGILADRFGISAVVGFWSLAGVVLLLATSSSWPARETISATVHAAQLANEAAEREGGHNGVRLDGAGHTPPDGLGAHALARRRAMTGLGQPGTEHGEAGA